jgi:hypothetical protein
VNLWSKALSRRAGAEEAEQRQLRREPVRRIPAVQRGSRPLRHPPRRAGWQPSRYGRHAHWPPARGGLVGEADDDGSRERAERGGLSCGDVSAAVAATRGEGAQRLTHRLRAAREGVSAVTVHDTLTLVWPRACAARAHANGRMWITSCTCGESGRMGSKEHCRALPQKSPVPQKCRRDAVSAAKVDYGCIVAQADCDGLCGISW